MGFVCPPRRCQSANPLYLWMWPYFNMVFVGDWVDVRSLGWVLIQCDWCSYKKGMFRSRDRHALRDLQPDVAKSRGQSDVPTGWGVPTVTSTPPDVKERGKGQILPCIPQREPRLTTSWSQASSFQNRETSVSPSLWYLLCSLSTLIYHWTGILKSLSFLLQANI